MWDSDRGRFAPTFVIPWVAGKPLPGVTSILPFQGVDGTNSVDIQSADCLVLHNPDFSLLLL